jgi:ribosome modulation factor
MNLSLPCPTVAMLWICFHTSRVFGVCSFTDVVWTRRNTHSKALNADLAHRGFESLPYRTQEQRRDFLNGREMRENRKFSYSITFSGFKTDLYSSLRVFRVQKCILKILRLFGVNGFAYFIICLKFLYFPNIQRGVAWLFRKMHCIVHVSGWSRRVLHASKLTSYNLSQNSNE